jgi:hypothetical protein
MEPVDCAGDDVGPGHPAGKRSQPPRPVFTSCAAVENSRKRNFLGSQRRVSLASARETISSQIWFCALSCRGRLRRLVSRAVRMRFSQRARLRWCSSRSAIWSLVPLTGVPVTMVTAAPFIPELGNIRWSEQERAARELLDRFGVDMDLHRPLGDAMGIRSRCPCSNAVRYVQRPATT